MSICSLVVYTRPEAMDSVSQHIAGTQGCEVAAAENGRIVVLIDSPDRQYMSDTIMAMNDLEGVVSVSLVFEYFEDGDKVDAASAEAAEQLGVAGASCDLARG